MSPRFWKVGFPIALVISLTIYYVIYRLFIK